MDNITGMGRIIKAERKKLGDNLDEFAQKIGISRQTLAKWESGQGNGPTVNDLLRMCELFNCDFGYLVGEYTCKKREATDIQAETGLSDSGINTLRSLDPKSKRFINDLLENPCELDKIAHIYCLYRDMKQYHSGSSRMGLINQAGVLIYPKPDGKTMKVPLSESHNYARFELLHEIQNFADRTIESTSIKKK